MALTLNEDTACLSSPAIWDSDLDDATTCCTWADISCAEADICWVAALFSSIVAATVLVESLTLALSPAICLVALRFWSAILLTASTTLTISLAEALICSAAAEICSISEVMLLIESRIWPRAVPASLARLEPSSACLAPSREALIDSLTPFCTEPTSEADFLGLFGGAFGQLLDFIGDDGEAASLFTGTRRLDSGVQSEQVSLRRDIIDNGNHPADFLGMFTELGNPLGHVLHADVDFPDAFDGLFHGSAALLGDIRSLGGFISGFLRTRGCMLGCLGNLLHDAGSLLHRLRLFLAARIDRLDGFRQLTDSVIDFADAFGLLFSALGYLLADVGYLVGCRA